VLPFPHFKWHHSRLHSWEGRMPQFFVCFQILWPEPLTLCSHPIQLHTTAPRLSVFCIWECGELSGNLRLWFCNWIGRHQLTWPKNLLCCSDSSSFCSFHPIIWPRSSSILLEISQYHCITWKNVQKPIPLTTDQSAYFQSSAGTWNPSSQST